MLRVLTRSLQRLRQAAQFIAAQLLKIDYDMDFLFQFFIIMALGLAEKQ